MQIPLYGLISIHLHSSWGRNSLWVSIGIIPFIITPLTIWCHVGTLKAYLTLQNYSCSFNLFFRFTWLMTVFGQCSWRNSFLWDHLFVTFLKSIPSDFWKYCVSRPLSFSLNHCFYFKLHVIFQACSYVY